MVEWPCTKERINERGQDILVEWSCANKRNKSMRTQFFNRMVVHNRKNEWKWTIYFVFSFLVLQKKTITRVESKISSFLFLVLIKGITRKRIPRFPYLTPVLASFPSDRLRTVTNYWAEAYLELCRTSTMELFCENNQRL